jgi:membrane fusion protein (multidrug efflux system)
VRLPQALLENAISVPQRAVMTTPQGQIVMIVGPDGKVMPRPIHTTLMSGSDFIVSDGLKGGEQVIVNGLMKARPGTVVKPVPWNPQAPILQAPSAPPAAPSNGKK